jgi:hypothetical protein
MSMYAGIIALRVPATSDSAINGVVPSKADRDVEPDGHRAVAHVGGKQCGQYRRLEAAQEQHRQADEQHAEELCRICPAVTDSEPTAAAVLTTGSTDRILSGTPTSSSTFLMGASWTPDATASAAPRGKRRIGFR